MLQQYHIYVSYVLFYQVDSLAGITSVANLPGMQLNFSHLQEPNTYPGPLTEVDFWTERAANLNSIHQQLSSERVRKVAKVLELVKSTYYPAFNRCSPLLILLK